MTYFLLTIYGSKISFCFNSLEDIIDFFRHFDYQPYKDYIKYEKLTFELTVLYPFKVYDRNKKGLEIGNRFYSFVHYSPVDDCVTFDLSLPF